MATTGTGSPGAVQKKITALQAGTKKDIVGNVKVTVAGNAMAVPQIDAKLGSIAVLYAAVTAARTALKAALVAYEAALPDMRQFIKEYEAAVKALFGVSSPQLLDFGIKPAKAKATPRTAAQKAVSSALASNTRKVRGPLGKNERAAMTTQGSPGLVLVGPDGTPIASSVQGPTPPRSSTPVDAAANLAPAGSGMPSGGGSTPAK